MMKSRCVFIEQHKSSLRGRSLIHDAKFDHEINVEIEKEERHLLAEERGNDDDDVTDDDVFCVANGDKVGVSNWPTSGVANGDGSAGTVPPRTTRLCSMVVMTNNSRGGLSHVFQIFEVHVVLAILFVHLFVDLFIEICVHSIISLLICLPEFS